MSVPSWLERSEPCSTTNLRIGRQRNYVENTLANIASITDRVVFSEKYASERGLLQSIDPRVKVVTLFSFLIAINLFRNIYPILAVYVLVLFLGLMSKVPIGFFIKRVWMFIPIFAGVIALPATLNIFSPGVPLVTFATFKTVQQFWGFSYTSISITEQGVLGALLFTFRVAASVSIVVLLTLVTHWADVLKALRNLGVPQIFVLVLSMTYQYIMLLSRLIQDMHFAKKARTIPHRKLRGDLKKEQEWVASRIGTVFRRSYGMIDDVHSAMLARGFRGEVKTLSSFTIRKIDVLWTIIAIAL